MTRWRRFAGFCGLSVLLLGLVPLLSLASGAGMDFGAMAQRASAATGVAWTSNLVNVVRLSLAEPGLWLLILGSMVPSLSALVMVLTFRKRGLGRRVLNRLRPRGDSALPAAAALTRYLTLVAGTVGCLLLVFELRGWVGAVDYARTMDLFSLELLAAIAFAALLDQGALLEEAGWRGYATPLLQGHVLNPLAVAVIIGIAWALWHVPRDVVSGVIERLGAVSYLLLFLPAFVLGSVAVSVIAAFFMNRLGGSLIPAIMVHGLANDAMGLAGQVSIDQALTPYHQLTKALPFCMFALAIVWYAGPRLGFADSDST